MKDILIEGHRILTTDNIADAVLAYAASSPRVMRRSAASHGATQSNPATRCAASRARAPTV